MSQLDSQTYHLFLIEDHPLMRVGLQRVIETEIQFKVCGEYGKGRGAIDAVKEANPDALLVDLSLPDGSGLELIKDLRAEGISAPILVVSMHDETLYAERVLKAGANGYLMKQEATEKVIEGLREILKGEVYISERLYRRMLKRMTQQSQPNRSAVQTLDRLSDREVEVFELVGRGLQTREIAATLNISTKTVDAHRAHIKEKLGLERGQEVVRLAVRWVESGSL